MTTGRLLILSAPSGAGKTSLAHALIARAAEAGLRVGFSVSYTTRDPRPGERNGVDYHFVDDARFEAMIAAGEFLEHAGVFGRRYGTGRAATAEALQQSDLLILDIDWQGARQVKAQWPEAIAVFIAPPSVEELERRLRGRGQDNEATIAARMAAAEAELAHAKEFDHCIVNADFQAALAQLAAVALGPHSERAHASS